MLLNEIVKYWTVFYKQQFPGNLKLKFHDYCLQLAKFHGSLFGKGIYDILNGENRVCRQARGRHRLTAEIYNCFRMYTFGLSCFCFFFCFWYLLKRHKRERKDLWSFVKFYVVTITTQKYCRCFIVVQIFMSKKSCNLHSNFTMMIYNWKETVLKESASGVYG